MAPDVAPPHAGGLPPTEVFCSDCLTQLIQTSHPEIRFSREADSAAEPVKWLDAVIHGRYLPPHVSTAKPELSWLYGHVDGPAAFRVRPYLDEATVDHTVLRAHVRSRLARWGEMQLSRRELVAAMTYDLLVLLLRVPAAACYHGVGRPRGRAPRRRRGKARRPPPPPARVRRSTAPHGVCDPARPGRAPRVRPCTVGQQQKCVRSGPQPLPSGRVPERGPGADDA